MQVILALFIACGVMNSHLLQYVSRGIACCVGLYVIMGIITGAYKKIDTNTIDNMQYDIVTFGLWPQTIKFDNVDIYENQIKTAGAFTYCRGSDGQWYAKIKEKAYYAYWDNENVYYSNGTIVASDTAGSYKWFKVEPIRWRVLTTNYNGTEKKLLLAEKILIAKSYDASSTNYQNSEIRKWLNSNATTEIESDYNDSKGFLKTAFTSDEQSFIMETSVVNTVRSTNPASSYPYEEWNNGINQYAIKTPMVDKVFLLSVQEATSNLYGFPRYDSYDNTRIRKTTDYAKASGAYASVYSKGGGIWWLRSPHWGNSFAEVYAVSADGRVLGTMAKSVEYNYCSVVPALCVSN